MADDGVARIHTVDLAPDDFPLHIEVYDEASNELLATYDVAGPGVLPIQGIGRPCRIVLTYGDGTVMDTADIPRK